jgi:hypothetical protein
MKEWHQRNVPHSFAVHVISDCFHPIRKTDRIASERSTFSGSTQYIYGGNGKSSGLLSCMLLVTRMLELQAGRAWDPSMTNSILECKILVKIEHCAFDSATIMRL